MEDALATLTQEEEAALRSAATWYANYHAREVAAEAEDSTALAVEERRRFLALVRGLEKLGVRFPLPDALAHRKRQVA